MSLLTSERQELTSQVISISDAKDMVNKLLTNIDFDVNSIGDVRNPNDKSEVLLSLSLLIGYNKLDQKVKDYIPDCISTVILKGNSDESISDIIPLSSGLPKDLALISDSDIANLSNTLVNEIDKSFTGLFPKKVLDFSKELTQYKLLDLVDKDKDSYLNEKLPNLTMFFDISKNRNFSNEETIDCLMSGLCSYAKDLQVRAQNREMFDAVTESFANCLNVITTYIRDNFSKSEAKNFQDLIASYSADFFNTSGRVNAIKSEINKLNILDLDIYNSNKARMEEFRFLDEALERDFFNP